jgi:hypothetical protein
LFACFLPSACRTRMSLESNPQTKRDAEARPKLLCTRLPSPMRFANRSALVRTGHIRSLTIRPEKLPGQAGTRNLNPSPSGRIPVAQQSRPYNRLTFAYHYRRTPRRLQNHPDRQAHLRCSVHHRSRCVASRADRSSSGSWSCSVASTPASSRSRRISSRGIIPSSRLRLGRSRSQRRLVGL